MNLLAASDVSRFWNDVKEFIQRAELGTVPDWIVAFAAIGGLATVWLAWQEWRRRESDRLHQYVTNVGITASKSQMDSRLHTIVTNANNVALSNVIVTVHFIPPEGQTATPHKWFPPALQPGSNEEEVRVPREWIFEVADVRFTDPNQKRWYVDTNGKRKPSET